MFMQKKAGKNKNSSEPGSAPSSRADTPLNEAANDGVDGGTPGSSKNVTKRKLEHSSPAAPSKKPKLNESLSNEGILGESIRRYLLRKPMTIKDLLKKVKNKSSLNGPEMMTTIAQILKKLNPDKQKIKEEWYLSLKA